MCSGEEKRVEGSRSLATRRRGEDVAEEELNRILGTLGLEARHSQLDRLHVVELVPCTPDLVFAAPQRPLAAQQALEYLELALQM